MLSLYSLMAKLHLRKQNIQGNGEKRKVDSSNAPSSKKCAESNESSAIEVRSDSEESNVSIEGSTIKSDSRSGTGEGE